MNQSGASFSTAYSNPISPFFYQYGQTAPGLSTLPQFSSALPQNPSVNPLLTNDTTGMGGAAGTNTGGTNGTSGMAGTVGAPSGLPGLTNIEDLQQVISSQNFPIVSTNPEALNADSLQYMNGFLRTQIGRRVRVEFLLGSNSLTERTGILVAVGSNYIIINEMGTRDLLACDFYNIKFVRFYY